MALSIKFMIPTLGGQGQSQLSIYHTGISLYYIVCLLRIELFSILFKLAINVLILNVIKYENNHKIIFLCIFVFGLLTCSCI